MISLIKGNLILFHRHLIHDTRLDSFRDNKYKLFKCATANPSPVELSQPNQSYIIFYACAFLCLF